LKTLGILGGMSAASTQLYYRELCNITRAHRGGLHSPELLIRSVNFSEIELLQAQDRWEEAGIRLNLEAKALERGGAHILGLATNTMHKVAEQMMRGVGIPLVHIADATAARLVEQGFTRPGLIATAFTMEQTFYIERLIERDLMPVIPGPSDRQMIHQVIYEELCQDIIRDQSQRAFVQVAERLKAEGADSLILGCTEVTLLLNDHNSPLPVFDTTRIHCEALYAAATNERGHF